MGGPVKSLEARYYTDQQVFKVETQGLLARTWQFGCHTSELAETGAYATFDIAGESLFAIRGRDDKIRVFYNVCQHRAHQLVSGKGTTRVVVCPYHAWTYELTGALRAGPNIKAVEGFDKSTICLTEVRCEEFIGFLFVNLDPDAKPMDAWFPDARRELEEWVPNWAELKPLEWVEIPEKCNWKVSVE
ncbi:MAG: Rieske (2Fe-2S) protein, partial [Pseudomonadota bacterium]